MVRNQSKKKEIQGAKHFFLFMACITLARTLLLLSAWAADDFIQVAAHSLDTFTPSIPIPHLVSLRKK
jgi:hypothetical protein